MRFQTIILLICMIWGVSSFAVTNKEHPRIYCSNKDLSELNQSIAQVEWKKDLLAEKAENLEKYLEFCKKDPQWLVSRLQMNWKTKHNKVYTLKGSFSHSEGQAPVPTVRFSGSRDWATDYRSPALTEIEPYLDDERGLYLINKKTGVQEWVHPSKAGHIIEGINSKIMNLAQDAAFLYWQTGDVRYAEFAAPIFTSYIEGMYYREAPIDIENSTQQRISGLATFEVIHEGIVIPLCLIYDYLYNYLNDQDYQLDHASEVFQRWGDQIINNGIPDNNWNLFQARFITYIALALDSNENYANGKGRDYYLAHTFDISTERQIALRESLLVYDQKTGIWPESSSYSVHVISSLLEILTLLDNFTDENELSKFPVIEKAALAAFQYLFPSGYTVAFGDAKHTNIPPEIFELLIANYHKYSNKDKELMISGLLNQQIEKKDYTRKGKNLFQLFFYVDQLEITNPQNLEELSQSLTSPTFYAPNVSLFIQRMGKGADATMVSTVGSLGNHSHVNGIAIELFANNYVLGPDMSKGPSYWHPDHREYYSQFPAHNTVVVDGISSYGRMRGYHPFTLDNYFPMVGNTTNRFENISFSKVSFVEPKTLSDQQRLTAIVKTESGKAYVVDIFRSRKKIAAVQKHEYFYHNQGQSLEFFSYEGQQLSPTPTDELGTHKGDMKAYDYLTDKQIVDASQNIQAVFKLKTKAEPENLMKLWIKGVDGQKAFSVLAPKSNALTKGTAPKEMLGKQMQTLVLRREHEAWNNPFAIVFNPYIGSKNPISKVVFPALKDNPEAQKIEVLHDNSKTRDIIIANSSVNDIAFDDNFYQKGLLSIIRLSENEEIPEFIFLSGVYKFEYYNWQILSKQEALTISIEHVEEGYLIQNDKPVVIKVPIIKGQEPSSIKIYENDQLISEVRGFKDRSNPNQMEFRLAKAYNKALIVLNK